MEALPPLHVEVDSGVFKNLQSCRISIPHNEVTQIVGATGSGKTAFIDAITACLDHQQSWFEQLNGRKFLQPLSPIFPGVRISGGRSYQRYDILPSGSTTIAEFLSLPPALTTPSLPDCCPFCTSRLVQPKEPDALVNFILENLSESRCIITTVLPAPTECTDFDSAATLLKYIESNGISGNSYVYIQGSAIDLDDAESSELFPMSCSNSVEVVRDRLIIREEHRERLFQSIIGLLSAPFDLHVHSSVTLRLQQNANWFCESCGQSGGQISEAPQEQRTLEEILPRDSGAHLSLLCLSPEERALHSTRTLNSIAPATLQRLFLLAVLLRRPSKQLLFFEHDTFPTALRDRDLCRAYCEALTRAENTLIFTSPCEGIFAHQIQFQHGATMSGIHPISAQHPSILSEFSLYMPFSANTSHHLSPGAGDLSQLVQREKIFAEKLSDGRMFQLIMEAEANRSDDTLVEFKSPYFVAGDGARSLLDLPGFQNSLTRFFSALPLARQHGLSAPEFKNILTGQEVSPLAEEVRFRGFSCREIASLSIRAALELFEGIPQCTLPLSFGKAVGLGALPLNRNLLSLSKGEEVQFILARTLLSNKKGSILWIPSFSAIFSAAEYAALIEGVNSLLERTLITLLIETRLPLTLD